MAAAFVAVVTATAVAGCGASSDETSGSGEQTTLVFAGFGGAIADAEAEAFFKPFEKETGIKVNYTNAPDWGQYTAAIQAGDTKWDVLAIDAQADDLEKYFEKLDCTIISCNQILDYSNVTDYSTIVYTYAAALCYNRAGLNGKEPTSWADFFDLKKFPGKRVIQNTSGNRINLLVGAMMATGATPETVTPFDLNRAFAELDKVKGSMMVTDGQPATTQAVLGGEGVMGTCQDSQVAAVDPDLKTMGMMWNGHVAGGAAIQIAKGSKNVAAAQKLIAYMTSAEHNAELSYHLVAAPSNKTVLDKANPKWSNWYATGMTDVQSIQYPWPYVRQNGTKIQDAFTAWIAG
ncbi:extracellular solute-binding protein [Acrocarpospora macrocephala]|nr:extracellular solute-binding protein [Acrocarpospora macrocephala]